MDGLSRESSGAPPEVDAAMSVDASGRDGVADDAAPADVPGDHLSHDAPPDEATADAADAPAEDAPDALPQEVRPESPAVDAAPAPPPTLAIGVASPLTWHGGGGGTEYRDRCPSGEVVIGYRGAIDDDMGFVGRLQALCGRLRVTGSQAPFSVEVTAGATLTARGLSTTAPWTAVCPAHEVVVGHSGQAGSSLDNLRAHCAPLTLGDSTTITMGVVRELALHGESNSAAPRFTDHCVSRGQLAVGVDTRAGVWVDAIRPVCASVTARP